MVFISGGCHVAVMHLFVQDMKKVLNGLSPSSGLTALILMMETESVATPLLFNEH
jgi:hypothetical protein